MKQFIMKLLLDLSYLYPILIIQYVKWNKSLEQENIFYPFIFVLVVILIHSFILLANRFSNVVHFLWSYSIVLGQGLYRVEYSILDSVYSYIAWLNLWNSISGVSLDSPLPQITHKFGKHASYQYYFKVVYVTICYAFLSTP